MSRLAYGQAKRRTDEERVPLNRGEAGIRDGYDGNPMQSYPLMPVVMPVKMAGKKHGSHERKKS